MSESRAKATISELEAKYIPQDNSFYIRYYPWFFYSMMVAIIVLLLSAGLVFFQIFERPLPPYYAEQPDGKRMGLEPNLDPSLIPPTILRFASKAATILSNYDFVHYDKQIAVARPFFTATGWSSFTDSIQGAISNAVAQQLIVHGVVIGAPVISNEGPIPGTDYAWRVQVPMLLTYESASTTVKRKRYAVVTIVRVSTSVNPQGIGIDQFIMV